MATDTDLVCERRGARPGSEGVRPNTFQTPNLYVDQLMAYLTPEEFKVLIYANRRIMGFHKRQDRIAFSQFCGGTVARDGQVLDRGTGMHEKTVRTALKGLAEFRVLLRVAENDPRANAGAEFGLQEDTAAIDWEGLARRAEGWSRKPPEAEVVPSQGNTHRGVGGTLAGEHGGTLGRGEGGTLAGDPQKKGKERGNQTPLTPQHTEDRSGYRVQVFEPEPVGPISSPAPEPPPRMPDGTPRLTREQADALEALAAKACNALVVNGETLRQYRELFAAGLTVPLLTEIVQETIDKGGPRKETLAYFLKACRRAVDGRAAAVAKPAPPSVSLTPAQVEYLRREDEERREWIAREREKARAAEEATAAERQRRGAELVAACRRKYGPRAGAVQ